MGLFSYHCKCTRWENVCLITLWYLCMCLSVFWGGWKQFYLCVCCGSCIKLPVIELKFMIETCVQDGGCFGVFDLHYLKIDEESQQEACCFFSCSWWKKMTRMLCGRDQCPWKSENKTSGKQNLTRTAVLPRSKVEWTFAKFWGTSPRFVTKRIVWEATTEFDAFPQVLLVTANAVPKSIGWASGWGNGPAFSARHVHHIARCSTFWSKQSTHGVTCTRRANHRWRPIPSRCAFAFSLLTKSLPLLSLSLRRRQLKRLPVWGKESAEEKLAAPKWKQSYQQRALGDDPGLIQIYSLEYRWNSSRMYRISFESLVNSIETTICVPKIRVAPDTPNTKRKKMSNNGNILLSSSH